MWLMTILVALLWSASIISGLPLHATTHALFALTMLIVLTRAENASRPRTRLVPARIR